MTYVKLAVKLVVILTIEKKGSLLEMRMQSQLHPNEVLRREVTSNLGSNMLCRVLPPHPPPLHPSFKFWSSSAAIGKGETE